MSTGNAGVPDLDLVLDLVHVHVHVHVLGLEEDIGETDVKEDTDID
jgi:hypothetical protein